MKSLRALKLLALAAMIPALPPCPVALSAANSSPKIDVILWFDTEDYLLPADDDACLRLATMLTERHIRATFKVVGEKARVLEFWRTLREAMDAIDLLLVQEETA